MRTRHTHELAICLLLGGCGAPATTAPPAQESSGQEATITQAGAETSASQTAASSDIIVPPATPNSPAAAKVRPVADPVTVSGDVYKVLANGPTMRVLEATWQPGQKDKPHGHPPRVVYALTDMVGRAHVGGEAAQVQVPAGHAFFQNAVSEQVFENAGTAAARALVVELKQGVDPKQAPEDSAEDAASASPNVYKVVFEDRHVRVLDATWQPGQADQMHAHPGLAAYFMTDAEAKVHGTFGQADEVRYKKGQIALQEPVRAHKIENVGATAARVILIEPKPAGFGAPEAEPAPPAKGTAELPVEAGDGEVTAFVDKNTGIRIDIGDGFTLDVPPGVRFSTVVTLKRTNDRPSNGQVADGFTRHAGTLIFDGMEPKLAKEVTLGIGIPRMPTRAGQRFVLAMETEGECTKENKRYELHDGCAVWKIFPTEFDEELGKVVAHLSSTGGYRLQFGWMPEEAAK